MEPLSLLLYRFPAARSYEVRLHGRGPTDELAARRSAETDSEDTRPCINTATYTTIPKGFAMAKCAKKVFSTYEDMKQPGVDLNTVSFNAMLDACAKCNAYIALIACGRDKAVYVELDPHLLHVGEGYCCDDGVDRAFRVWRRLRVLRAAQTKSCTTHSLTFVRSTRTWTRVCDSWARYEQRALLPPTTRSAPW